MFREKINDLGIYDTRFIFFNSGLIIYTFNIKSTQI